MLDKKTIVKQVNAALRANDLEAFMDFYTEDAVWTRVGEKSATNKAELRQLIESLGDAPPPRGVTFEGIVAENDTVVVYGNLIGQGDDGETAPRAFCDIYRFRGDKIAEQTDFLIKL